MHVSKLPSGSWRVQVRRNGRRRYVTASTKSEAVARAREVYAEMSPTGGSYRPTVAELIERRQRIATHWKPNTVESMRHAANRIPDVLMNTRADEVSVALVEDAYELIVDVGGSARRATHSLLCQAFDEGVRIGALRSSVMTSVNRPENDTAEVNPPSPADVKEWIAAAGDGLPQIAVRMASTTGMRRGEIAAIAWSALELDADRDHLLVRRNVAYTTSAGQHMNETKTGRAGHRRITLGAPIVRALRQHRTTQLEESLANELPRPEWVFSDDAGVTCWRAERLGDEIEAARDTAGVSGEFTTHSLRHFAATQMLAAGIAPRVVAYRLGHSSVQTTERIYAHWIPGLDAGAADIMDRIVGD